MRVNELNFLNEYTILEGFVCWRRERAQEEYEARSRNWIWLDNFTRCYKILMNIICLYLIWQNVGVCE